MSNAHLLWLISSCVPLVAKRGKTLQGYNLICLQMPGITQNLQCLKRTQSPDPYVPDAHPKQLCDGQLMPAWSQGFGSKV